jgi:hypothetical protein
MTTPIAVTPEMRKAVYEEDCGRLGHMFHLGFAVGTQPPEPGDPNIGYGNVIAAPTADELPRIVCSRCGKIWLIMEEPGDNYDDAETKLQNKLKATDPLSKHITEIRNNRKNPKPPKA